MARDERRKFPRIADNEFAMELRMGEFDTIVHTLNVSASGVYCKIDREIPLMSRVKLVLMMPGAKKEKGEPDRLEIEGVVVRGHPVVIDGQTRHYDMAIFFDTISPKEREAIARYIAKKTNK